MMYLFTEMQPQAAAKATEAEKQKTHNYLTNLNMDPALSGYIRHFLEGDMSIGNKRGDPSDICLPGEQMNHASADLIAALTLGQHQASAVCTLSQRQNNLLHHILPMTEPASSDTANDRARNI